MILLKIFTMIEMNVEAVAFALTCKIYIHSFLIYFLLTDHSYTYTLSI